MRTWWQELSFYMQELFEGWSATNIQEKRKVRPNASKHREEEEGGPKEVGVQQVKGGMIIELSKLMCVNINAETI